LVHGNSAGFLADFNCYGEGFRRFDTKTPETVSSKNRIVENTPEDYNEASFFYGGLLYERLAGKERRAAVGAG
jgi:hypothetical protein